MEKSDFKILVVDDEPDIVEFLTYNLVKEGYVVKSAGTGEECLSAASVYQPHVIVLDLMLPGIDGIEVCEQLRKTESLKKSVIIILSARSEDYSQIEGIRAGADDYITKPVKLRIFMAKISAQMRRFNHNFTEVKSEPQPAVKNGNGSIEIHRERHSVTIKGKELTIPKKEFALLLLLSSKPGVVFTRESIYSAIWGNDVVVSARTIDVHVRKLREKIGNNNIITLKGVGYKFVN